MSSIDDKLGSNQEHIEGYDLWGSNPDHFQVSSRLPGFFQLSRSERAKTIAEYAGLDLKEQDSIEKSSLTDSLVNIFIENSVGTFELPLGIATNFKINQKDYLIPMAVEESSVLAAASHGAKFARAGGGFTTWSTDPIMIGQIQVILKNPDSYQKEIEKVVEHKELFLDIVNEGQQRLFQRGGGAIDIKTRFIKEIRTLVLHLHVNTQDAMGANIVNTMCERLAGHLPEYLDVDRIGLCILSNLTDTRLAGASCRIPASAFKTATMSGEEVVARIEEAWLFAYHDPYRACTNNKGVMNGIDPVVIATGNDWRAVEAGAHAYCSISGEYKPMASWRQDKDGSLIGQIEIPMALGTVGGVTKLHPTAKAALKILGYPNGKELGEIACAVGLAQNLSALRALATEGIQKGHMDLHKKNLDLLNDEPID